MAVSGNPALAAKTTSAVLEGVLLLLEGGFDDAALAHGLGTHSATSSVEALGVLRFRAQ